MGPTSAFVSGCESWSPRTSLGKHVVNGPPEIRDVVGYARRPYGLDPNPAAAASTLPENLDFHSYDCGGGSSIQVRWNPGFDPQRPVRIHLIESTPSPPRPRQTREKKDPVHDFFGGKLISVQLLDLSQVVDRGAEEAEQGARRQTRQ